MNLKNLFTIRSTAPRTFSKNDQFIMHPQKHWRYILGIFIVLVIVMIGVSGYFFFEINNDELFGSPKFEPEPKEVVNREKLDRVLKDFKTRSDMTLDIQDSKNIVSDPSL